MFISSYVILSKRLPTGLFDVAQGLALGERGHVCGGFLGRLTEPSEGNAPGVDHQLRQLGTQVGHGLLGHKTTGVNNQTQTHKSLY